jgi:hypothetical protein
VKLSGLRNLLLNVREAAHSRLVHEVIAPDRRVFGQLLEGREVALCDQLEPILLAQLDLLEHVRLGRRTERAVDDIEVRVGDLLVPGIGDLFVRGIDPEADHEPVLHEPSLLQLGRVRRCRQDDDCQ